MCFQNAGQVANSVDPGQKPHSVASYLDLHCLLRPFCPIHRVIMVTLLFLDLDSEDRPQQMTFSFFLTIFDRK